MISDRFETLAQAFRVFAEQQIRFRPLFMIDAPEAVGNLDHAIDGILNGLHGLHEAVKLEAKDAFDFYGNPICAFVLRLRNARHHNHANRVRSIYRRARDEQPPVNYLLVSFAAGPGEEGGRFGEYHVAWSDVLAVLALEPKKYAASVAAGRDSIGAEIFEAWCAENGYSNDQIFINLIPILSAAGSACAEPLAKYIRPESVEGEAFLNIFQTVERADFDRQEYIELTSAVFWPS